MATARSTPAETVSYLLVAHGWHTGLVFRREDIEGGLPSAISSRPERLVEIGWGDQGFYTATKITAWLVVRAFFWPTPSVIHLAWFDEDVATYFPESDVVELTVPRGRFEAMCRFISASFGNCEAGKLAPLRVGLYGVSCFAKAGSRYFFPKTCNVWTARALCASGFRLFPWSKQTAGSVTRAACRFGRTVRLGANWGATSRALRGGQPSAATPRMPDA